VTAFIFAIQFLTRIPIPITLTVTDKQWGQTVLYYPLVGFLIGCQLALVAIVLPENSIQLQAALILAFWVLITGGLHLDGLADCADAWAGGLRNPQRSLAIMKDPHSGAIAIVTLIIVLLLKWTALTYLLAQSDALKALLVIPALGRSAILALMLSSCYVSEQGLAQKLILYLPKIATAKILLLTTVIGFYILSLLALVLMFLMIFMIRFLSQQRLGGVTGDVYGATVELVETVLLISVVFLGYN
jgi:adenosylcobinamide-GDP ribazoletransferase